MNLNIDKHEEWVASNPLALWFSRTMGASGDKRALAKALGVSKQTVWNWLTGRSLPRSVAFDPIKNVTGVTKTQWLDWWRVRPREAACTDSKTPT